MILAYLLLYTGLTISSVAIYYSVVGLTAIFSAAAVPIMIMGVSLEVAKLVCATWIKQYWTQVPRLMKIYMCVAITVLMLITSMGIFGFLSKAHNDQNLVSGDVGAKLAIYDEKIKTARDNIDAGRKQLKQMDEAVDQVMGRSTSETGADKAVAIRRGQQKDRTAIARDIETNQKIISQINDEAAPIRAENRKVEAEVGPIKYIAAFLYGVEPDSTMLEKAVTWIIIMIVVVFDPLAVIMLLAAQMTFAWHRGERPLIEETTAPSLLDRLRNRFKKKSEEEFKMVDLDAVELDALNKALQESYEPAEPGIIEQLTPNEIDAINKLATKYTEPIDPDYTDYSEGHVAEPEPVVEEKKPRWSGFGFPLLSIFNKQEETTVADPFKEEVKEIANPNASGLDASDERPGDYIKKEQHRTPEAAPGRNRGVMFSQPVQADTVINLGKASHSDFGNTFPDSPEKGDIYLRTDYLPNRLYKFNGQKWIEVDKSQTDVYAYDSMYIKHLIAEIDAGRYDPDALTDVEREQIREYITKNV